MIQIRTGILFMSILLGLTAPAQLKTVSVSGFNADIIANGVGDAINSVTASADAGNYALVSQDFVAATGGTSPTYYLPADGWINSTSTAGLTFHIANYSFNNTSRLSSGTSTSEILTFDTAQSAAAVYLLAYSGSGTSTADFTINFANGTQQTATITISDWYNGTPFVIQGIGRVNTTDNTFSGTATNPRLYSIKIAVDNSNFNQDIQSISISKTDITSSVLGILGVSILRFNPAYMPVTLSGFNADVVADGTGDPAFSTNNDVDGAIPPYVFVAPDYQYDATCSYPVRALPASGLIGSNALLGMAYQLAPYTGDNDLRLTGSDSATLMFATPVACKSIYLLGVGGNGAARISANVTYNDNSTEYFSSIDVTDWYGTTTNAVIQGIGRLKKTTVNCTGLEVSAVSPKLYQLPLMLSASNHNKAVVSVTITRIDGVTGFSGIPNIMAATAEVTNIVLPLTMSQLSAYSSSTGNVLKWSTTSETDTKGFEIEKSADGKTFSKISFVQSKATEGATSENLKYNYLDKNLKAESNSYYRIKQISVNGKMAYSNVALIKGKTVKALQLISLYPNPVTSHLKISLNSPVTEQATVIITDITGKAVMQHVISITAGSSNYSFDLHTLHRGSYLLKIDCGKECNMINSKFIKL